MKIADKFFMKEFKADTNKDAYLKACKWAGKYIIGKVEIGETFLRYEKVEDASLPTIRLELYCVLEEGELRKNFCNRCEEFHKAFYINQFYNCDRCNVRTYLEDNERKLKIKKNYRKERLEYLME